MDATLEFDGDEDQPTLLVKLGSGHWMSVTYAVGGPPDISLSSPSDAYRLLEDDQIDVFRAWLAGAAGVTAG